MPSVQQGQVVKTRGGSWSFRFYDVDGKRRQKGGYQTKSAAAAALKHELDEMRHGPQGQAGRDRAGARRRVARAAHRRGEHHRHPDVPVEARHWLVRG